MGAVPSLTVVLPVYNGEGWVGGSLEAVDTAVRRAGLDRVDVLVVDDGSTDGTVAEVRATPIGLPLRVLSGPNGGRFVARRRGLAEARGDLVLFVDTRVRLHPDALAAVAPMLDDPDHQVWTAHVEVETRGNPIARFWRAIEHVAWRRYHDHPRHVTYGIEEFDWYPKGTTALLCPRRLMQAAYDDFSPTVADPKLLNDDTALLRFVARRQPINISPDYSCTYHARTSLPGFLRHAHHRGAVLIDGYLQPGARFANAIRLVLAASPLALLVALRRPKLAVAAAVGGPVAAAAVARAKGADREDAVVLGALAVPFGIAYLAGMWRGVLSRARLRCGPPPAVADRSAS
jgi:glycosyltransferase involved in cell wall biosynthesis